MGKCKFYQESNNLVVEYMLNTSCEVEMALYTVQGELLAIYPKKALRPGQYRESIAIDSLLSERYVLRLIVNGKFKYYYEKFIKPLSNRHSFIVRLYRILRNSLCR